MIHDAPWPLGRRVVKRAFDVVGAAALLAAVAPTLLLLGLCVRATSPGPALFRQRRLGRGGRPFLIYKLRTMRVAPGALITAAGDPRVTPIGRWLRRTKIDELPQLINVLRGDMSFVGPRPEVPEQLRHYSASDRAIVLSIRPGITDAASIAFRDEEAVLARFVDPERAYAEVLLPRKLALARQYVRRQSFLYDLRLLIHTARAL
jgi:lipopolysaccharide/colanic/teichoic acid biosynthesis glycosyltransferase